MNLQNRLLTRLSALATAVLFSAGLTTANATEPCDDFGECKVLIEINAEDGDVGFHFLMDGDNLIHAMLFNEKHKKMFSYIARRELRDQFVTETFVESAEPLCWPDPDALEEAEDEGEDLEIVTLADFLDLWSTGDYHFFGIGEDWEFSHGVTQLSFALPAAPADLDFNVATRVISWAAGDDLGNCAENAEKDMEDEDGIIPNLADVMHLLDMPPGAVPLASYEVVLEPDVEDGDPTGALKFTVRVPPTQTSVTVPEDYLDSLPDNTLMKVEVGGIGLDDNATFAEEFDFCVNEDDSEFPNDDFDGCGIEIEAEDP